MDERLPEPPLSGSTPSTSHTTPSPPPSRAPRSGSSSTVTDSAN
jgi:hypothetical protein